MKNQQTSDFYFEKMACTCYPAYTGPNCENELDACDIKPCSPGQSCTDLTATQQGLNNTGYICGPCPAGFRDFNGKCVDVDECDSVPDICDQLCTNTEGSYSCSCRDGFRLEVDGVICKDINECVEHTSSCSQRCINEVGNYSCGCWEGYTLQEDHLTCSLETLEQGLMEMCNKCQQICNIDFINRDVLCNCTDGYLKDSSNKADCIDINECDLDENHCQHACVNTQGSFDCYCRKGYQLAFDGRSCSPCEIPAYGINCSGTCDCKGQGSCDPVEGCMCDKNWSGESCDIDVNECDQENVCPNGQLCRNTLGSFHCQCPSGYEKNGDDCLDINECEKLFTNTTCDLQVENCVNTPGSYICRCKPGFTRNNVSLCKDIDECKLRIDGCSQICKNVEGKYNCECFNGFRLAENRHDCVLFRDICTGSKVNCTSICSNEVFAASNCVCPRGYQKINLNGTEYCKDLDECANEEMNHCSILSSCVNADGNFICSCPDGYSLDNDKRGCLECTGQTWGHQCSNDCECGVGADHCDSVTGCVCKPGYTGEQCKDDIDECSSGVLTCRDVETCINIPGSAYCKFNEFSTPEIGHLMECDNGTFGHNCLQNCSCVTSNTDYCNKVNGSCVCKQGWTGDRCQTDVDECRNKLFDCPEHSNCVNTIGSYDCGCYDGYIMISSELNYCKECASGTFGTNCSLTCSCNMSNTDNCNKVNGSCVCKKGWIEKNCDIDINECLDANDCQFKERCMNFNGGYNCSCPEGFYLDTDGHSCLDCPDGKYGRNCANVCGCVRQFTRNCNKLDGKCECVEGRQGNNCSEDVDECKNNSSLCTGVENLTCENTLGSYRCLCKAGFTLKIYNQQELCEECPNGWYGLSCSSHCRCASNAMCDKINGSCYCGFGWTGETCDIDIDECSEGLHDCDASKHLICSNTRGSYTCLCQSGYTWSQENNDCIVPYYPFGTDSNDILLNFSNSNNLLSNANVYVSKTVYLSAGVAFGSSYPATAQILTNGVIAFDDKSAQVSGIPNLTFAFQKNDKILSPYWSDIDPNSGQVYYQLYERCGSSVFMEKPDMISTPIKTAVMTRAEADIAKFHHLNGFTANVVLVATWVSVSPLSDATLANKRHNNTFQAIFVSGWKKDSLFEHSLEDPEVSYVIYIYQKQKMKWPYVSGRIIQIGFTNGLELKSLPNTNSRVITLLGNLKWNTDFEGVISYQTGMVSNPPQKCHRYLCDKVGLLYDPVYENEKKALYACPCSIAKLGQQWLKLESSGRSHDIQCYAITGLAYNRLLTGNKRNKLCCYKTLTPKCSNGWQTAEELKQQSSYVLASPDSGHVLITNNVNNRDALENMEVHKICCANSSQSLCEKFYMIFPEMGCSPNAVFLTASAFSDPHIKTLDGITYTMNGWGEYILMEVKSENFTLQARTKKVQNIHGQEVNATVFSAFAAKEGDNASLHVELAHTNLSMIIYINEIDFTNDFYKNPEFSINLNTITATQECVANKTLLIVAFSCGVTLKVSVSFKNLEVEIEVAQSIRNKTAGLFGNFNGDITDEFVLPNGTLLPANITEKQIFYQFAKNWEVTSANSIFIYKDYETALDYQHPDFKPLFFDDVDASVKLNASRICGNNRVCLYDFIALQDPTFALNTQSTSIAQDTLRQNLENSSPTISINTISQIWNGYLIVTSGKETSLSFITRDTDGDNVTIETVGNIPEVRIDKNTIFVYTDTLNPFKLGIRAKDSRGAYSPILYVAIATCSGCSGHGICDSENMKNQQTSDFYFEKMACSCYPAYTGPDCENELDACDIKPCSPGQSCTDLTATQQGLNNTGYICGPCPAGFRDFNGKCVDIDECEEHTSSCSQRCINKDGNYSCGCWEGYTLQEDQFSCILYFFDPFLNEVCNKCEQICDFEIAKHDVHCGCTNGYLLDSSNGIDCLDINECAFDENHCQQECLNTEGSFECSCRKGYKLASDGLFCSPCEIPAYGMNCSGTCDCKGQGSCDPVEGCVCDKNWSGESCDIDVNECDQENVCPNGQLCRNTLGSFHCQCPSGYEKKGQICEDINECDSLLTNITCDLQVEDCFNTHGSFSCKCKAGFTHNNVSICKDIDECKLRIDGCSQICKNVEGKYNCECFNGYMLADNRHDCVLFRDVCTGSKFNCTSICSTEVLAVPNCVCPRGYQKIDLNGTQYCKDLDECVIEEMNHCSILSSCLNVDGNFICSCPDGYSLDNDKRSCIECTGQTWGHQCSNDCECGVGADHCDSVTGCVCKPGYTGELCKDDVDECSTGFLKCRDVETCINVPGSAYCKFNVLSTTVIGHFADCETGKFGAACAETCLCEQANTEQCSNVDGSCRCKQGWMGDHCQIDVDECKDNPNQCNQIPNTYCVNSVGTFKCICNEGYIKSEGGACEAEAIFSELVFDFDASKLDLSSNSSTDYIQIKNNLETELNKTLRQQISELESVEVVGIRKGSLHVDIKIVINNNVQEHKILLTKALVNLMKTNHTLMINDKPSTISVVIANNEKYEWNEDLCDIRKKLEPCLATELCVEKNEMAICKLIKEEKNLVNLIVGLSVSLPLFVLLVIATGVLFWFCSRKTKSKYKTSGEMIELSTTKGQSNARPVHHASTLNTYDEIVCRRPSSTSNAASQENDY